MELPLGLPNPLFYFLLSSQLANEFRESIQKIPLAYDSKSESLRCCKGKRQPEAEETWDIQLKPQQIAEG